MERRYGKVSGKKGGKVRGKKGWRMTRRVGGTQEGVTSFARCSRCGGLPTSRRINRPRSLLSQKDCYVCTAFGGDVNGGVGSTRKGDGCGGGVGNCVGA